MKSLRVINECRRFTGLPGMLSLLVLSGCAVGPQYERPDVAHLTPADWRWKVAEPRDDLPKGAWWKLFQDPALDRLESSALANNQTLQAAIARVDQARAAARLSRSRFFPEISLSPAFRRERTSGNLPTPIPVDVPAANINTYSVPFDLSYEIDLWGRVRRSFEAARAQAEANVADYQNVLLTLTADVAALYFQVRALETELESLRRSVELRTESVDIIEERFAAGAGLEIDLARARTELATAKADMAVARREKEEALNGLALLCGRPASSFELAAGELPPPQVAIPAGLPAELLERRPDIARAERQLASSNARIGVARAAYFPAVRLTGQAGYLSAEAQSLFSTDSRVWSIGPAISIPLFNAGRTAAEVRQAQAVYHQNLAEYRQVVLTAFKEVEDSMAGMVLRQEQAAAEDEALEAARRVSVLAKARYDAGFGGYLEYVDAERLVLMQERKQARLSGQRLIASVRLIKALGGGWEPGLPPSAEEREEEIGK